MTSDQSKPDWAPREEGAQLAAPEHEVKKPRLFKVLLHNDDYTTMEFVVMVLMTVFHRTEPAAVQVMLQVHQKGVGVAGVYSYEVAEARGWQGHKACQGARISFALYNGAGLNVHRFLLRSLVDDNARA